MPEWEGVGLDLSFLVKIRCDEFYATLIRRERFHSIAQLWLCALVVHVAVRGGKGGGDPTSEIRHRQLATSCIGCAFPP